MSKLIEEINFYGTKPLYRFLSNFYGCPQVVNTEWGVYEYPTNEHFYQAMKANNKESHYRIGRASSPHQAMKAGRALESKDLKYNWDDIKVKVMLQGLRVKFSDPHLRTLLLDTKDAILREDSPSDMFWGKKGKDMLGKLLMQIRKEVR